MTDPNIFYETDSKRPVRLLLFTDVSSYCARLSVAARARALAAWLWHGLHSRSQKNLLLPGMACI